MACLDRIIDLLKAVFWKRTWPIRWSASYSPFCAKGFSPSPKTLNVHEAQGFQRAQALRKRISFYRDKWIPGPRKSKRHPKILRCLVYKPCPYSEVYVCFGTTKFWSHLVYRALITDFKGGQDLSFRGVYWDFQRQTPSSPFIQSTHTVSKNHQHYICYHFFSLSSFHWEPDWLESLLYYS